MGEVVDFQKFRDRRLGFKDGETLEAFLIHPLTVWCNKIVDASVQIEECGIADYTDDGVEEVYFLIRGNYQIVEGVTEYIIDKAEKELKGYSLEAYLSDLQDDFTFTKLFLFFTEIKETGGK